MDMNIPSYLTDVFSMYLENMSSLDDPENPSMLSNYLAGLFEQLKDEPLLFDGMVDQLAMAISVKVRVDSKSLAFLDLSNEPTWGDVKACVGVHADARPAITQIMHSAEQDLKMAILVIHFYSHYDSTPIKEDNTEDEDNYLLSDDYDENY